MQRWSWLLPSSGCFAQSPKASGLWGGESSCACRRVNGAPGMDLGMWRATIRGSVRGKPDFWTQLFHTTTKTIKGGETGRKDLIIGWFGNPFLKETQWLVRLERGKGSSSRSSSVGGLGKPLPHPGGRQQLPSGTASPRHPEAAGPGG